MIKAVKFVSIPVRDQDKALEFYTKKLGLKVMTDSPFDGKQRWIELAIPRADTKIVLFTAEGQDKMIGGFSNITFVADDVEATAKEMKAKGVEFVQDAEEGGLGHGGDLQGRRRQPVRPFDALIFPAKPQPIALHWRRMAMAKAFGAAASQSSSGSSVHRSRRPNAGARHRRHHGDVLGGGCSAAQPAAVSECGSVRRSPDGSGKRHRARPGASTAVLNELSRKPICSRRSRPINSAPPT